MKALVKRFFISVVIAVTLFGVIAPFSVNADTTVAKLWVFSYDGNSSSSLTTAGHSFIVVKNFSSSSITVGKMTVPSTGSVTLGTWGNKNPTGLWYNLESYFIYAQGDYNGRVSLIMSLTASQLSTLNTQINSDESWGYLNNCSSFAKNAWNSVSSIQLSAGAPNTPANLKNSIKNHDYDVNFNVAYNSNVGYYIGNTFYPVNMSSFSIGNGFTSDDIARALWDEMHNPNSFPGNVTNDSFFGIS